jgi:hypothetical protein
MSAYTITAQVMEINHYTDKCEKLQKVYVTTRSEEAQFKSVLIESEDQRRYNMPNVITY